jgi:hypothetical protein
MLSQTDAEPSQPNDKGFFNLEHREQKIDKIISLNDYQNFVNQDWKRQHGTYEAAKRFHNGLVEEYKELVLEYAKNHVEIEKSQLLDMSFIDTNTFVTQIFPVFSLKPSAEEIKEIVSEAGDVIFYTVATMSNSSADLDAAMKKLLYRYTSSVVNLGPYNSRLSTPYRDLQAETATSLEPISIATIDELISQGLEPIPFNLVGAMNIDFSDGEEWGVSEHFNLLFSKILDFRKLSNFQYRYFDDDDPLSDKELAKYYNCYDHWVEPIGESAANILLETAYLVKHTTGQTLSSIIDKNYEKIIGRVSANRIDKSDGERTQDLL